ncbi:DUF1442 FAMILY PROTEIN [Salix viminalis]|uniref:DUF1442 FAMILY PROTEIN n=1 Tax=Salix viminalis TaxID=40686 RepID=A0A9Q0SG33_SALVM|nr:DUF1442 FAMILY PROTEIN [Salix viminalis]
MHVAGMFETEVLVGEVEEVMAGLAGVDFLVVDCKRRDFLMVLRWHGALGRGTRVVKTVFLPVGQGLDMAHIGSPGGSEGSRRGPSRWIRHVDQKSGEEHVFRG